ncbi:SurA N-terminal domain-containing protein [Desulfobacterales bacterium HSG2]|nr:SurA N-terminal domain-containing protein [Desulfobacterales bacterium HSG2]
MINNYFDRLRNFACWLIYVIVFCGSGIANAQDIQVVDRIVAVVNDEIISLFELEQIFKPYREKIKALGYSPEKEKETIFKVREDILNQLIDQKLTDQEIGRTGITISEREIDSAVERIKESAFYTDEDLRMLLSREGMTMEEYRKRIKEKILRTKLVNREVKSKIVINEEDVKSYYENHQDAYQGGKKYNLRHILLEVNDFADKDKIKEKAESILAKLKAGQSFEKMASKYSESASAAKGGDLGLLDEEVLSEQIREAVKELEPGEFTPVLDTDLGYQIFFIEKITDAEGKSLKDASPEIEQKLFEEIVNEEFRSWLEKLRKRSHIKIIK